MKTKMVIIVAVLALALSFSAIPVYAETNDASPDSLNWKAKIFVQKLQLTLTFDDAEKAKKAIFFARDRLEEIAPLADAGKFDAISIIVKQHNKFLETAKKNLESMSLENHKTEFDEEISLSTEIAENKQLASSIYGKAKLRLTSQDKEQQEKVLDNLFNDIEKNVSELEIRIENKKDKTRIRYLYREKNKSAEEIENETSYHEKKALDGKFEQRASSIIDEAEDAIERSEKIIEKKDTENKMLSAESKKQLASAINLLGDAKSAYSEGNYYEASNIALGAKKLAIFAASGTVIKTKDAIPSMQSMVKKIPVSDISIATGEFIKNEIDSRKNHVGESSKEKENAFGTKEIGSEEKNDQEAKEIPPKEKSGSSEDDMGVDDGAETDTKAEIVEKITADLGLPLNN